MERLPQAEEDYPQPLFFHTLVERKFPSTKTREDLVEGQTSGVKRLRRGETISFSDDDLPGYPSRNDPLVIMTKLGKWELRRILVDPRTSSDVLYR